jgi:thiamine biosynthesis lipoprotein
MGTVVTLHLVGAGEADDGERAVDRAISWFRDVEARCTRFDPASELMRLCSQVGTPVSASAMLFEVVQFALAVADESGGAFDPTVGAAMERRGFTEDYRTGRLVRSDVGDDANAGSGVSYRDVCLDATNRTVTLQRPLVLDLGAVAKGFAIDLAAQANPGRWAFAILAPSAKWLRHCPSRTRRCARRATMSG